jgi:hypothetical protein
VKYNKNRGKAVIIISFHQWYIIEISNVLSRYMHIATLYIQLIDLANLCQFVHEARGTCFMNISCSCSLFFTGTSATNFILNAETVECIYTTQINVFKHLNLNCISFYMNKLVICEHSQSSSLSIL